MKVIDLELMEAHLRHPDDGSTDIMLKKMLENPQNQVRYQIMGEVKQALSPESLRFRRAIRQSMALGPNRATKRTFLDDLVRKDRSHF